MCGVFYLIQEKIGDAYYAGQGRADFVGHCRKEIGFDPVRFLSLFSSGNQLSLIVFSFRYIYYLEDKIQYLSLFIFCSTDAKPPPFRFTTFGEVGLLPLMGFIGVLADPIHV